MRNFIFIIFISLFICCTYCQKISNNLQESIDVNKLIHYEVIQNGEEQRLEKLDEEILLDTKDGMIYLKAENEKPAVIINDGQIPIARQEDEEDETTIKTPSPLEIGTGVLNIISGAFLGDIKRIFEGSLKFVPDVAKAQVHGSYNSILGVTTPKPTTPKATISTTVAANLTNPNPNPIKLFSQRSTTTVKAISEEEEEEEEESGNEDHFENIFGRSENEKPVYSVYSDPNALIELEEKISEYLNDEFSIQERVDMFSFLTSLFGTTIGQITGESRPKPGSSQQQKPASSSQIQNSNNNGGTQFPIILGQGGGSGSSGSSGGGSQSGGSSGQVPSNPVSPTRPPAYISTNVPILNPGAGNGGGGGGSTGGNTGGSSGNGGSGTVPNIIIRPGSSGGGTTRRPAFLPNINKGLSTLLGGVFSGNLDRILTGSFIFAPDRVQNIASTVLDSVFGSNNRLQSTIAPINVPTSLFG